jgi:hypothetical protein
MASSRRGISVGVEIDGTAKGFKSAAEAAAKDTAELNRKARQHSREIEQSFKMVTIAIAKIAAGIVVAKKAFEVYSDVMKSTHATADKLEIQISQVKFSVDAVKRAVATGNFKDFGKQLKEAADAGKYLAEKLDQLAMSSLSLILQTSGAELKMVQLELVYKNKANPWQVRIDAIKEYLGLIKKLEVKQLKQTKLELSAALGASSIQASKISEERLRFLIESADAINDNESAIKKYAAAQKELNIQLSLPLIATGFELPTPGFDFSRSPQRIAELKTQMMSASGIIKNFGRDYDAFMLITDKDLKAVTEAFANFDRVQRTAGENALKPSRTLNSLLGEETKLVKDLADDALRDLDKAWKDIDERAILHANAVQMIANATRKPLTLQDVVAGSTYVPQVKYINENLERTQKLVGELQHAFEGFFQNMGEGFDNMAKAFIAAIEQMVAEMMARAAIFLILSAITGGGKGVGVLSEAFKSMGGKGGLGKYILSGNPSASIGGSKGVMGQSMQIFGSTRTDGKDIYTVWNNRSNILYGNT